MMKVTELENALDLALYKFFNSLELKGIDLDKLEKSFDDKDVVNSIRDALYDVVDIEYED